MSRDNPSPSLYPKVEADRLPPPGLIPGGLRCNLGGLRCNLGGLRSENGGIVSELRSPRSPDVGGGDRPGEALEALGELRYILGD